MESWLTSSKGSVCVFPELHRCQSGHARHAQRCGVDITLGGHGVLLGGGMSPTVELAPGEVFFVFLPSSVMVELWRFCFSAVCGPLREEHPQQSLGLMWMSALLSLPESTVGITTHSSVVCLRRCSPGVGDPSGQIHENRRGHHLLVWLCNHCQRHPCLLQEGGHHFCVSSIFF